MMALIDQSIAVDPIEYIGIPFSFHYFKPNRNIINNHRMPSQPFMPIGSVLGFYFHFLNPFIWFADECTEIAPCLGRRDQL